MSSEQLTILFIILFFAIWLLYLIWYGLMMASNRKEKDGYFIDQEASDGWKSIEWGPLQKILTLIIPYQLFPNIYTDTGNKYRLKFIHTILIGLLGFLCVFVLFKTGVLQVEVQSNAMGS